MLGSWAHEGLQSPSNPEERKGLKEARSTAQVHSAAHPNPLGPVGQSPPRSRAPGRNPRQRPASPPHSRVASLPSSKRIDSASLEATPRRKGQTAIRSPVRRTEVLNAHHFAVAPGSDSVRPPLRTAAVTRVLSANSGHCSGHPRRCGDTVGTCDAVRDVLGTATATVLPTPRTSLVLSPPRNPRTAWAQPSEAAPTFDQDRTPACRTLGAPPRHAWRTVPPTTTTMPPAGVTRMPARSPQGQRRHPGRPPR